MASNTVTESKRPLLIEHDIEIRTYDIDGLGHVSNISYLRWMEDMRLRLFDRHFPFEEFIKEGISPVVASTFIQYKKPIKLFDRPRCYMWMSKLGNASFAVGAEIMLDGLVATEVEHVGVFIDLASGKPVRVPKRVIEAYRATNG